MASSSPSVLDRGGRNLFDDPETLSNILVSASAHDEVGEDVCGELLAVVEPAETNVLWVSFSRSADRCVETWTRRVAEPPRDAGVIVAGGRRRSGAADQATGGPDVGVETIDDPGNLTELGVRITDALDTWSRTEGRVVLCFHSLTALLQYAGLEQAYQFLHTLTSRVRTLGGIAHYHIDPAAHDEQSVATLRPLFGTHIAVEDGEVAVR